jgi:transcriptional regulator with XRE-family HTH domain
MNTGQPPNFGDYVKEAREHHGYSVRHLAALIGVAPSTIARIEYNTLVTPGPDLVLALIKNLALDTGKPTQPHRLPAHQIPHETKGHHRYHTPRPTTGIRPQITQGKPQPMNNTTPRR